MTKIPSEHRELVQKSSLALKQIWSDDTKNNKESLLAKFGVVGSVLLLIRFWTISDIESEGEAILGAVAIGGLLLSLYLLFGRDNSDRYYQEERIRRRLDKIGLDMSYDGTNVWPVNTWGVLLDPFADETYS